VLINSPGISELNRGSETKGVSSDGSGQSKRPGNVRFVGTDECRGGGALCNVLRVFSVCV
jgi:hypothetical protein